jgi:hypothetical protein
LRDQRRAIRWLRYRDRAEHAFPIMGVLIAFEPAVHFEVRQFETCSASSMRAEN